MPLTLTINDIAPHLAKRMRKYIAHHKGQLENIPHYRHPTAEILREERKATKGFARVRNLTGGAGAVLSGIGAMAMGLDTPLALTLGGIWASAW
jgi:predicted PurR-regulated permease PerM